MMVIAHAGTAKPCGIGGNTLVLFTGEADTSEMSSTTWEGGGKVEVPLACSALLLLSRFVVQ